MKKLNLYTEFELDVKLLDAVNSKEEFDYLIQRVKGISPSAFFFPHVYRIEKEVKE